MNVTYDPALIQRAADALYKQAKGQVLATVFLTAILGVPLMIGAYALLVAVVTVVDPAANATAVAGGGTLFGYVGLLAAAYEFAQRKVLELKARAQMLLCALQTETNTRKT